LLSSATAPFRPTPTLLAVASDHPAGLIVASPSNPTGTMLDAEGLRALADYCGNAGIRLVSDEIYHGIVSGPRQHSMLECTQSAIVINSFSKYYSMTGWRLGWMIVPEDLVRPIERVAQNLYISAPTLSQLGASAPFECGEELNGHVRRYQENRDLLLSGLPSAGL